MTMPRAFRTLDDLSPQGQVILLRADLNVPMQDGRVSDATRIERLVPGLRELSDKGAKIVLLSHFGRPKGKDTALSLRPLVAPIAAALQRPVAFADDCIGPAAKTAVAAMKNGDILLLENVRFHAEEEKDDDAFARQIAALGDAYINDAFSAAHRAHATTHGIARLLPAYAGRLMEAELTALGKALEHPERPVAAIVGGAKISTKLDLLGNLVKKIDVLILGGGMANTFLFAQGLDVGKSLCERDMADNARAIMDAAKAHGCRLILPSDAVTAKEFKANTATQTKPVSGMAADDLMLDIGPDSVTAIKTALGACKTLLWNGPAGAFETPPFDAGTMAIARIAAELTAQGKLVSVAGGGDTVAALAQAKAEDKMTYVSTAGGAFLEWLEGKELPGVQALTRRPQNA